MKYPFTKTPLSAESKQRLRELLKTVDPNCIIGMGILMYLGDSKDIDALIQELRGLIDENPAHLADVIGPEAMSLLDT
jgi:hypothetical protein